MAFNRDEAEKFQSTLPVWGATKYGYDVSAMTQFQSTLPVWGATQLQQGGHPGPGISIHAPRVGSDIVLEDKRTIEYISIHAPRVGSDLKRSHSNGIIHDFNPRSPCGERLATIFDVAV